jgi:hypothetical protein
MPFHVEDHDVTCLCALVDLPCAVIVEELPAAGGRARFQLQAFPQGAVGELLRWVEPVLKGVRVRRWEGAFAMARIEVEEGEQAAFVRQAIVSLQGAALSEVAIAGTVREQPDRAALSLRALARVLG